MRLPILTALFLLVVMAVSAQQQFTTSQGVWTVTSYAPNIIKLRFQPKQYTSNENVTAAVIAPVSKSSSIPVRIKDDRIIAGVHSNIQISYFKGEDYRGFRFALQEGEKIFGGGERALPLNRRGYRLPLYNNPWYGYGNGADALNFSVPFFTSSNGYALFFDNASKGYADIGKTAPDSFEAGFSSGELNVYIITGNYQQILSSYFKLTGTQPLPPRWAMGNLMSRFGYTSEQQVKAIAAQMKAEHIPFDAIIFDLFWFGDSIKNTLGNLDWINHNKWPDPKGMIAAFQKEKINTVLIAEPFMLEGTKNYEASKPYLAVDSNRKPFRLTDFYFGYGGLLDIFRKDAGDWIWNQHYKKQIANGVHAWWTDLGEPEKHPAALQHNLKDLGVNRLAGADAVHNIYGHYWNKMLMDHYKKEYPNQRIFHLNRSGFSGSQRFSIFPWSGDVSRSWSGFQGQLPLMLGMSMSGIPYIHADAGGFAGGEGDAELYTRWLQFAAFTPVFRPHGTALYEVDPNAYSFPSEPALIDSPYRDYARSVIRLRYALLPYNYTLAWQQSSAGKPLVAPLYYAYPKDTAAANVNDEFFWGEQLLVAPVTEKNSRERRVYLPAGNWYRLQDATRVTGNQWIKEPAAIHEIPVFVKEGACLPAYQLPENLQTTHDLTGQTLKLMYYPSAQPATSYLYADDGISVKSKSALITIKAITKGNQVSMDISANNPAYFSKQDQVLLVGCALPFFNNAVKQKQFRVVKSYFLPNQNAGPFIRVPFNGQPVHLEFSLNEN